MKELTKLIVETVESNESFLFITIKDIKDTGDDNLEYSCADAYNLSETDLEIIKDYIKHELGPAIKDETNGLDLLNQARGLVE